MQFCLWGEGTVKAQPQDRPKPFVAKPLQTRAIGMLENVDDEDDGDDDGDDDDAAFKADVDSDSANAAADDDGGGGGRS